MLPTLPFTALRALEAVVRLRGFGRAAEELGVTQSSVSQHVKALEEWIGRRLLVRGNRGAEPTAEGRLLAEAVSGGLGQIAEVCDSLRSQTPREKRIVVSCPPGFAFNWLFPRLIRFDQAHPEIPVSISTDPETVDFSTGSATVAIRYGIGGYRGLHVERLMGERVFPVCAPVLLEKEPGLRRIADLAFHTFLLDELAEGGGNPPTWEFWAEETGVTLPKPERTRRFGQANMVVQAAVEGLGVALGREPMVVDAMRRGALVRPFPQMAVSQYSYWLVCPKAALRSARMRRFRDWISAEAAQPVDLTPPA